MIRDESEKSDVVIQWPRDAARLRHIRESLRCPSHARPLKARRNALVALVDSGGTIQLLFRLQRIGPPRSVIGADGKRYPRGCVLHATPGSMREPRVNDPKTLEGWSRFVGAPAYFDAKTLRRVWYRTGRAEMETPASVGSPPAASRRSLRRIPFMAETLGREIGRPEADLVNRFTSWLGGMHRFGHQRLKSAGLFVDLHIRGHHILIEAKAWADRKTVRYAIGQLYDYRRFFPRRPRLALLLPERPSSSMVDLLRTARIRCIWETRTGSFRDSVDGAFTKALQVKS